jgi:hypothetical protein
MPGLDPGIHPSSKESSRKRMDGRVKPGHDESYFASTGSGGTLSFGAPACMVINVIDVTS